MPDEDAIRIWNPVTSIDAYFRCESINNGPILQPAGLPPTQTVADLILAECEDTPPLRNGWGWDGYGSCRHDYESESFDANFIYLTPDYIAGNTSSGNNPQEPDSPMNDAPVNDGVNVAECIDSDNDGWGWDGSATCIPETVQQSDSCPDPDGDGWGWTGTESCRASMENTATDTVDATAYDTLPCVDSDRDGWGWQQAPGVPGRSCRVP